MDVTLLHNEKAGKGSWSRKDLTALVRRAGFNPRYHSLKRGLAQPKLLDWGDFIIVAGGDGAIRKASLALLGRNRPIAPLPLGTANNIARSLALPLRLRDVIKGWRKPVRRAVDVGVIKGPWGERQFIEGVGVGLISRSIAVLRNIDKVAEFELKNSHDKLHRDVCVAAALAHEMSPIEAELELDGREHNASFLLLEILNIRRAGPGVELAPHASPSDGRFDVVTATDRQRPHLIATLSARLRDDPRPRSLNTRRARQVRLTVHTVCDMRIDDATERVKLGSSMELTILPGALEYILPER